MGKNPKILPILVPLAGLEPARSLNRGILSPLRLPIPPQRHLIKDVIFLAYCFVFFSHFSRKFLAKMQKTCKKGRFLG